MARQSVGNFSFALCALLSLVCLSLGGVSQADNCDNKCRARKFFYVCGTTTGYWEYSDWDCFLCYKFAGSPVDKSCEKAVPSTNTVCTQSGFHFRRLYTSGGINCDCAANITFVEATRTDPNPGSWQDVDRYVCPANE